MKLFRSDDGEIAFVMELSDLLTVAVFYADLWEVQIDFFGVDATTQSFVHALISEAFRRYGPEVLDRLIFKNCNEVVRGAVVLVAEYMQESLS